MAIKVVECESMGIEHHQAIKSTPIWLLYFGPILATVSCALAFIVWLQTYSWPLRSPYQLFPLFGLLAFSLMWCHYVTAATTRISGNNQADLRTFFSVTGYMVLAFLLLHPGILVFQLWTDTGLLPPLSYIDYVGEASKIMVVLGSVALICFLLYETKRWLAKTTVWPFVVALSDIAMVLIFIHGLRLGSSLQFGWYRYVWIIYGLVLVLCITNRFVSDNDKIP